MCTSKTCTSCKQEKPVDQFYKFRWGKDGRQAWCKDCMKASFNVWHTARKIKNKNSIA